MRKQITILSVATALMAMISCGNSSVPSDGIFGEIPAKLNELVKDPNADIKEATAEIREKMKGQTIPYEMGDGLEYTIDKAPVIEEVKMTDGRPTIVAEMDVVFNKDLNGVNDHVIYYFLVDDDQPLKAENSGILLTDEFGFEKLPAEKSSLWEQNKYNIKKGDKMHRTLFINQINVVPILLSKYKKLKFVSKDEFDNTDVNANAASIMKELDK